MSEALVLPAVIGLMALSTIHVGVAAFLTAFLAVVVLASD
ncbi:putative membrane protein [Halorubrum sp. AJ67]|nr:putative membrane protein [Halorubrum sp. AJ67]